MSNSIIERCVAMSAELSDLDGRHCKTAINGKAWDFMSHAAKFARRFGFETYRAAVCQDVYTTSPADWFYTSYSEDYERFLTRAGKRIYCLVGQSDYSGGYSGEYELQLGCPSAAYYYKFINEEKELLDWGDVEALIDEMEAHLPELERQVKEHEEDAAMRRRAYGREINEQFRSMGADKAIRDAWWAMAWKKEVDPEAFMNAVYCALADRERFALALYANSRRDLEALGWMCRPSVPRTEAMLAALSKATGIKAASREEWIRWKTPPTRWVFGE